MVMGGDLELLEKAVEARAKLLRVEAADSGQRARQFLLTFDVGRVRVGTDGGRLSIAHIADPAEVPEGLESVVEDEPWWRFLGQSLTAAWPGGLEAGLGAKASGEIATLKLRFREIDENPRTIRFEASDHDVAVTLEDVVRDGG